MIKKTKGKYQVQSKRTRRNMGTYKTYKGALKRLREVEYFKHHKKR